jgi:subtilisin family serine protease
MCGQARTALVASALYLIGVLTFDPRPVRAVVSGSVPSTDAVELLSREPSSLVVPASQEILVRFKDNVTAGVAELFQSRTPFKSATADQSASLDVLFRQLGVRGVRAVFRDAGPSPEPISALRLREAARIQGALQASPLRSERADTRAEDARAPELFHVYRLELGPGVDAAEAAAVLARDPHVEWAEPNRLVSTAALPNDSFLDPDRNGSLRRGSWAQPYSDLWGMERVGWPQVWRRQAKIWPDPARRGGGGVIVAVIDTGVEATHPDLAANIWRDASGSPGRDLVDVSAETLAALSRAGISTLPEEDYTGVDGDPADHNGHGTHIAGTIGAVARNGKGIAGIAWRSRIMPVRAGFTVVRSSDGAHLGLLEEDDIAAAIRWAAENGADVINMSFGMRGIESRTIALALQFASSLGAVLVAAAGNDAVDASGVYPAANPLVVSVGATLSNDRRIFFSNWGMDVDIAAPGTDILSTRAEGTAVAGSGGVVDGLYTRASGTSMAAPHVAGAVALVLSAFPKMTPADAVARVIATADPVADFMGAQGVHQPLGSGRLNLMRALTAPARATFVLRSWTILDDADKDRVAEAGETVRVRIELRNAWRVGSDVSVRLVSTGPGAVIASGGTLASKRWAPRQNLALTADVRVGDAVAWGTDGNLRLEIRGKGIQQDMILPITLRGPGVKAGWPAAGEQATDGMVTSPSLGDLDQDGDLEVFALSSLGDAFLREADGSPLPGWPVSFDSTAEQSSPLIEDLDGDGDPELVFVRERQVHVLDGSGRSLSGWPREIPSWVLGSPSAGDLNGDGRLEIVAMADDATLHVFDSAGQSLPGWPRKLGTSSSTGATLVDLDGKPGLEIVAGTVDGTLMALRADGTPPPGAWPVRIGYLGPSSPAVADLDGDGEVDIVAASVTGRLFRVDRRGRVTDLGQLPGIYAFSSPVLADLNGDGRLEIAIGSGQFDKSGFFSVVDATGHMLPGWPVATAAAVAASPALADLDGDRRPELIVADLSGRLHAWRADGRALGGFPYDLGGGALGAPVVADLDRDGTLEIVVGKMPSSQQNGPAPMTVALEYGKSEARPAWVTFQGNSRRTGTEQE